MDGTLTSGPAQARQSSGNSGSPELDGAWGGAMAAGCICLGSSGGGWGGGGGTLDGAGEGRRKGGGSGSGSAK